MTSDNKNVTPRMLFNSESKPTKNQAAEESCRLLMRRQQIRFAGVFFLCTLQAWVLFMFAESKEFYPKMVSFAMIMCLGLALFSASIFVVLTIRSHRRFSGIAPGKPRE